MILRSRVAAIELAGDEVRVAVILAGRGLPQVLEVHQAIAQYEEPELRQQALTAALDDCLNALKHRPSVYVLCGSSAYSVARQLVIPFKGSRKVAAAVPLELEPFLAFPLEDLLVDYIHVQEVDGETDVLALGLRRTMLDEQLAVLAEAGIEADAVNLDGVSLTGLWQLLHKGLRGLNAVLHLREEGAILAVTSNRRLAFLRHLATTPEQIAESPVAVSRELQNTLRTFLAKWRGQEKEFHVLHVTGVSLSPAEKAEFEDALGLAVEDCNMLSMLPGPASAEPDPFNTWEAAVGAGIAAAGGGYSLDFTRAERDWNSVMRAVVTHLLFSSCLALLVLLGLMLYYFQGASRHDAAADDIQAELDVVQMEILDISEQTLSSDIDLQVFADPTLLDILREISTKMPDNKVTIDEIRIAPPGARGAWINIEGKASDSSVFNEVFADFRETDLLHVLPQPDIRVEGPLTMFRVQANRAEEVSDESDQP